MKSFDISISFIKRSIKNFNFGFEFYLDNDERHVLIEFYLLLYTVEFCISY